MWSFLRDLVLEHYGHFELWSMAKQADPSTAGWLLWLLQLSWWQTTIGVLCLSAMLLGTKRVLRWPSLALIVLFLFAEFVLYFSVRTLVYWLERCVFFARSPPGIGALRQRMQDARSYDEWRKAAEASDDLLGARQWKAQAKSRYFNDSLLQALMRELRTSRTEGDVAKMTGTLQTCLHKNVCGILNEQLYSKTLCGTKFVIDEYVEEVLQALDFLEQRALRACGKLPEQLAVASANGAGAEEDDATGGNGTSSRRSGASGRASRHSQSPAARQAARSRSSSRADRSGSRKETQQSAAERDSEVPASTRSLDQVQQQVSRLHANDVESPHELLRFFQAGKRQFGATALCLSGGASLGNFHWGIVQALLDEGLLPRIVSGTSSGAVVAALVCTRTDEELRATINPVTLNAKLTSFEESWFRCAWRFLHTRAMYDSDKWHEKLQFYAHSEAIPHMTFAEAHARTGRILSITCTAQRKHNPSMLLNFLTAPNVTIATAILASAAVPGFIRPVVLMEKINGQLRPYHDKDLQWCDGSLQRDLPLSELSEQFGCNSFIVSQCNPHIIPWFFNARGQSGVPSSWRRRTGGYRGGFLLSALELFLKEDMKKSFKVMNELELMPSMFGGDFSFLFLQDFQGTVTLVPNASLRDFCKIISDPSVADLTRFLREGRLTAWRKFSMIRNRLLISHKLNGAIASLSQALHGTQAVPPLFGFPTPAGNMACLDHPFEHEPDTLAGLHPISYNRKELAAHDRSHSQL